MARPVGRGRFIVLLGILGLLGFTFYMISVLAIKLWVGVIFWMGYGVWLHVWF